KNYQLVADVTLASEIAKNGPSPKSPVPPPTVKVKVEKTPQGFLRVRQEPSLSAPEIGRVKTGDELEVIQETKDWVKVQFEGKQGWVSSQYVKKLP
ncbi:MAG: SH3 domain-containing protein, partial [Patescibacteria group bacterium]